MLSVPATGASYVTFLALALASLGGSVRAADVPLRLKLPVNVGVGSEKDGRTVEHAFSLTERLGAEPPAKLHLDVALGLIILLAIILLAIVILLYFYLQKKLE